MTSSIEIYQTADGLIKLDVAFEKNTVWLSRDQMADLFDRDKSVISKHLKRIFLEQELEQSAVVAFFATTAADGKTYQVEYYNLDAIISVGYRVKSKRGVQFRQWATQTLKEHLIKGYTLNEKRLGEKGIEELEQSIQLLACTLRSHALINDMGQEILTIINNYTKTWRLLLQYDEQSLPLLPEKITDQPLFTYEDGCRAIHNLKHTLMEKGEATPLFGNERNEQFKAILGNVE